MLSGFAPLLTLESIRFLMIGLVETLKIAVVTIALSIVAGSLLGLARSSGHWLFGRAATVYIELIRNLPCLLLILFMRLGLGAFGIEALKFQPMNAAIIGLTAYTSAMVAEIVRGGLNGVDKGQWEAARAQGLGYWHTVFYIILPQALRKMIPALVQQFVTVVKDSAFASIISVQELTAMGAVLLNLHNNPMETYLFIALIFFVINYAMSLVARRLERGSVARAY